MDIVDYLDYGVSASLVVLGGLVGNSAWAERHKKRLAPALIVIGLVGLVITWVQDAQDEGAALGDPDYPPYLWWDVDARRKPPIAQVYIVNPSKKYAAHSVIASLALDDSEVTSRATPVLPSNRVPADFPNKLGNGSNAQGMPQMAKIGARFIFCNTIATSAGSYHQVTLMVRSSEAAVLQATQVSRVDDPSKILVTKQDKGFPPDFQWPKLQWRDSRCSHAPAS